MSRELHRTQINNFLKIRKMIQEQKKKFNKEMKNIKKEPKENLELENTTIELKKTMERFGCSLDQAQGSISEPKDRSFDMIPSEGHTENEMEKESLHDLWDAIKRKKSHIIGFPRGGEREKGAKTYV